MADDAALRMRRSRAHRDGDHSMCRPGCQSRPLRVAGDGESTALSAAVAAEFAEADPMMRSLAARLAELAAGHGPAAVQAVRQLAELTASWRERTP